MVMFPEEVIKKRSWQRRENVLAFVCLTPSIDLIVNFKIYCFLGWYKKAEQSGEKNKAVDSSKTVITRSKFVKE